MFGSYHHNLKTILKSSNVLFQCLLKREYSTEDSIFEEAKRSDHSISSRASSWREKGLKFENIGPSVCKLSFARQDDKNVLSTPVLSTLLEALRLLAEKNEEKSEDAPKVVILSGEGIISFHLNIASRKTLFRIFRLLFLFRM